MQGARWDMFGQHETRSIAAAHCNSTRDAGEVGGGWTYPPREFSDEDWDHSWAVCIEGWTAMASLAWLCSATPFPIAARVTTGKSQRRGGYFEGVAVRG